MVNKAIIFIISFSNIIFCQRSFAQRNVISKTVTYEEVYDDPYDINRLFVQFQPIYGEFFRSNINLGFGLRADYFLDKKADFTLQFRKPYGSKFDFSRDNAKKNSDFENSPKPFFYVDLGGAYHILDKEVDGKSKFVLFSKSFQNADKWESMTPEYMEAPIKLRRIYSVRTGGTYYQSTLDVNDISKSQNINIVDSSGNSIPGELKAFGNILVSGIYIGGGMTIIKNVALKFDKTYDQVSNDLIFSAYFDLCYAPGIVIGDLFYKPAPGLSEIRYFSSSIKTSPLGFRLGIDGKFNRNLSWGYGIETGIRPGIKNQGLFIQGRISFPIIGSTLSSEVEAFGK